MIKVSSSETIVAYSGDLHIEMKNIKKQLNLPYVLVGGEQRILSARPDTVDFRDLMYTPSLIEVPPYKTVEQYKASNTPILDQGLEGACTGFGLATVANYLLRTRTIMPDYNTVSPRMLYEMAKRYDEWPGEDYEGSSARGAMKGWHKHGVCSESIWPYDPNTKDSIFSPERSTDALQRPLGAYFRVNHKDIVAMHAAITEAGILYATSLVHQGWTEVKGDGIIHSNNTIIGGHAFAIVGYDQTGFWIQNSWGPEWGKEGFARISYGDWLKNGSDVWVARLGVPIHIFSTGMVSAPFCAIPNLSEAYKHNSLRPYIVSLRNNGKLSKKGEFATTENDLEIILRDNFTEKTKTWKKKRLVVYAHGGLVSQSSFVHTVKDLKSRFLNEEIYPLFICWNTDLASTLNNMVEDSLELIRTDGPIDDVRKFMQDRLDESIELIARLPGKAIWDEIKENAKKANQKGGGLWILAQKLRKLALNQDIEIHLVSHSAGSILLGGFSQLLTSNEFSDQLWDEPISIASNCMWAPACTNNFFKAHYMPGIQTRNIKQLAMFTMSDESERSDSCCSVYSKSLLYLVSNSFEDRFRPAVCNGNYFGEPILGMERFLQCDSDINLLISQNDAVAHIVSNSTKDPKGLYLSTANSHGEFDTDIRTVESTINYILGKLAQSNNDAPAA